MELKYIIARDAKSATEQAAALFGRDVLIISSHQVGGQTELVVAVDAVDQAPSTPRAVLAKRPLKAKSASGQSSHDDAPGEGDFGRHYARAQAAPGKPKPVSAGQEQASAWSAAVGHGDSSLSDEIVLLIRDQIAALRRDFIFSQKASGWQSGLNLSAEVEALLASFTAAGMPTGLRTLLLHTVQDMQTENQALQAVREQLNHALRRPSQALPQTGVHLLVGPSGAGKTLMVARLARHAASVKGAGKVTVVSYRDARVGGWHQEHLSANVAGVEYFRADDSVSLRTLQGSMELRQEHGLVLIDTAGPQMAQRVAAVQAVYPDCSVHAVVAADSSCATLNRILQTPGISWASLMISKLDESVQPWPLVEFLCSSDIMLSAASDGSHVADLRLDFSAAALVEMAVAQLTRIPEPVARSQGLPAGLPVAYSADEQARPENTMHLKFSMPSSQLRAPERP